MKLVQCLTDRCAPPDADARTRRRPLDVPPADRIDLLSATHLVHSRSRFARRNCSAAPTRGLAGASEAGELVGDRAPFGVCELSSSVAVGDRSQHTLAGAGGVEDSADVLVEAGWFLDVGDRVATSFRGAAFL